MSLLSAASSLVGLFLGLEAFTLVLYILISLDRHSPQGAEAGLKYLVLGVTATGALAFGIALIYASAGTFHLPEALAGIGTGAKLRPIGLAGWALLLLAVGFKVSLVPFHLWTPDVYQGAPAPITGLLSAGSKGAMFSALVTLLAGSGAAAQDLRPVLWVFSAVTMGVGTLAALRQENVKRLLAYSSVVHMGIVLLGLVAGGVGGRSAVVFYLVFYAAVSLGAFGVIASLSGAGGEPQALAAYRGIGYRHPFRAAAMTVFLLALAGIPPTGGFMAKLQIFAAAIQADALGLALIGILVSLISLYYYLKIIIALYMTDDSAPALAPGTVAERVAVLLCLLLVLALGLFPAPILDWIGGIL
jgi:NADH-quinone oxidoreductase subunit N